MGGGLGRSVSVELGLNVNRSTSEKTLVCLLDPGMIVDAVEVMLDDDDDEPTAFSLPRLVEKARKKLWGSFGCDRAVREEPLWLLDDEAAD